jgi:FixJ family two-component response regulator
MARPREPVDSPEVKQRLLTVVIDDDPSVRKALLRLLRSAQMEVEAFASGDQFLVTSRLREPDCLVLDVRMPGMTGPELRARLTAAGRPIPIVFITGYAEDEKDLNDGEIEVLRKPFGEEVLLTAIERAVRAGASS